MLNSKQKSRPLTARTGYAPYFKPANKEENIRWNLAPPHANCVVKPSEFALDALNLAQQYNPTDTPTPPEHPLDRNETRWAYMTPCGWLVFESSCIKCSDRRWQLVGWEK